MIVKMKKVLIVGRGAAREELLEALRELGVVHLEPADPQARAPEALLVELEKVRRAGQVIASVAPVGESPAATAREAVEEIMAISRRTEESRGRLNPLAREAERLKIWGGLRREQLEALSAAGVPVKFYSVSEKALEQVQAECIALLAELAGKRRLVAVIQRAGEPVLPEGAEAVEPPDRDLPTVQAEAKQVDSTIKADAERLAQLANLAGLVAAEQRRLEAEGELAAARAGALKAGDLFAVQGWAPADAAETLASELAGQGMSAAVDLRDPQGDEQPPTLICYPRWARPIKGLFDILGTVSGYKEFDAAAPFMMALPIFAAMLIGDGGYGIVLLLGPLVFWKRARKLLGAEFAKLLMVVGAVALIWGAMAGSFFGVVLYTPLIPLNMTEESRNLVMRICFYMGAVHLSVAQLWRGVSYWPSLRTLSRIGWAVFIWGMLGVVSYFVLGGAEPWDTSTPWPYLLAGGALLAILFESPSKNPLKMIGLGLANFPLSMLSSFSDVISYVRLMAVGLASGVLAGSFNELAVSAPWLLTVPILIFGHALNMGLALIALFAHGVRLNMLEFSNNLGMQWTGHAYRPFAKPVSEEIETC